MKEVYNKIRTALQGLDWLKWFDYDFGQLQFETPPLKYPCCLFSIDLIDYSRTESFDIGEMTFTLRCCFRSLDRTRKETPNFFSDIALEHLDKVAEIIDIVRSLDSTTMNNPVIRSIKPGRNIDPRVYDINFTVTIYKADTEPDIVEVPIEIEIDAMRDN